MKTIVTAVTVIAVVLSSLFVDVRADTPANCTYEDIRGSWIFSETARNADSSIDCTDLGPVQKEVKIELRYPNIAIDEYGVVGTWTIIYNQGFEVTVNGRIYFAFSYYEQNGQEVTNFCDRTFNGWSHDVTVRHWACFSGQKASAMPPKVSKTQLQTKLNGVYKSNPVYVDRINKAQKSWTAKVYDNVVGWSLEDIVKRSGGRASRIPQMPAPIPATREQKLRAALLPESWDWRNVDGKSYVSDVRDQGGCGSCYAFSAVGMLEARLRLQTRNELQLTFSPQDIVDCTEYAQGCAGGFPYLIAGKYGLDFGVVEETCNPYTGRDGVCKTQANCTRYYTATYNYVGGYYGGCNEEAMKLSLVENGPLSVSFEVYGDFSSYRGGIYHYTGFKDEFNPFDIVNHAVLLVGYGADETTGEKFWIVKNSWGANWGEDGYFRIRRGTNEVGIESIAVEVTPIPN